MEATNDFAERQSTEIHMEELDILPISDFTALQVCGVGL